MSFFQILFSPKGRIRRRDYWLYSFIIGLGIPFVEYLLHRFVFGLDDAKFLSDFSGWLTGNISPFSLIVLTLTLLFIYPAFCVQVKRWHDRNRPAIVAILVFLCGWGGTAIQVLYGAAAAHPNLLLRGAVTLINLVISIWVFIECGCLDGTPGPNRYGPSPKGRGVSPAAVF